MPVRSKKVDENRNEKRRFFFILVAYSGLLVFCISIVYLSHPKFISTINNKFTDTILATSKATHYESNVIVVTIDEKSLKELGQWPWPRHYLASLLTFIEKSGARSVGLDILFPEQDRFFPPPSKTSNLPFQNSNDQILADTFKDGPFVLGYEFLFNTIPKEEVGKCVLHPVSFIRKHGSQAIPPKTVFHIASGVLCNTEVLEKAIPTSGFFNGRPDDDGVMRRLPLLIEYNGSLFPSFGLAVFMQSKKDDIGLSLIHEHMGGIHWVKTGKNSIPVDDTGNYLLGPVSQDTAISVSAIDVLKGKVEGRVFKNKIVLIGLTALGLNKEYATPNAPMASLLELHRQSIDNLLSGNIPIRNKFFLYGEVLFTCIICCILLAVVYYFSPGWAFGVSLMSLCGGWVAAIYVYRESSFLFSPLLPTLAILLCCSLFLSLKYKFLQHRAQEETGDALFLLKNNEENMHSILKAIPDIVFRLDKDGNITFISPAISKYLPSPDTLLGNSIFNLVDPEDMDKAQYRLNERRTGERATYDLEIRLLLAKSEAGGTYSQRFFSISAEGIYQGRDVSSRVFLGTQGIVRDITEKKRLESQLMQAQKMEVIGNLAAGIAHDLNNILSGMVSYPDLLLLELPEASPLREKVAVIQKSGKRAATIVQDLLTLARRGVEVNDICNMNTIIMDFLSSVEFQRAKKKYPKIEFTTTLQENLLNIKGSAVHLSKVFMNVLHNAMEAMPVGGEISISTSLMSFEKDQLGYEKIPKGEYICTTIKDNGVGISRADLQRIFEPFYSKKSMSSSGTGLGMTVIWATVKDHHGFIDISSSEGIGTALEFYLPATIEKTRHTSRVVLEDYVGSETVLVVDDLEEQLEIAGNMLRKLGYTVLQASSGEEAVTALKQQSVDLVILDMLMPDGFDGLETYQEIVKMYPHQKAIIVSGFSESERVKKLQKLGVGSYVQKPYSLEKLGMAVREELEREQIS